MRVVRVLLRLNVLRVWRKSCSNVIFYASAALYALALSLTGTVVA
jgi:hypothetical protein